MPTSDEYWYRLAASAPGMLGFIKESRGCTLGNSSRAALTTDHRGHADVESGRTWLLPITTIGRSATIGDEPIDRHPREFLGCPRSRHRLTSVNLSVWPSFVTTRLSDYSLSLSFFTTWLNWRTVGMLKPEVEAAVVNLRRGSSLRIPLTTPTEGKMDK